MSHLEIRLLGLFQVHLDGQPITRFRADSARALLAYLTMHRGLPLRREALAGLLWADEPDRVARDNLRQVLSLLRTAIGDREADPPYLLTTRPTIAFNPESDYWLDVDGFSARVSAAQAHPHPRPETCATCASRLAEAVELYRGDFLGGFSLPSALFEGWMVVERECLHRQALDALNQLAAYHDRTAAYEQAGRYARRALALEPWHEEAHRRLMRALALSGQRGAALAQYEACRDILAAELGLAPAEETRALYERMRDGEDLTSLANLSGPHPLHNLPAQLTPFVGREELLARIRERLADPDCRLLTLVGPGGSGKTRLALQAGAEAVAAASDRYPDGVYLISLVSLRAEDSIAPTIVRALGYGPQPGQDPTTQLLSLLRRKQLLLILDNYEHLLGGSPTQQLSGARVVIEILRAASEVQILVTSRIRLNVLTEQVLPVGGMAFPAGDSLDGEDLLSYSAVTLFLDRARAVRPNFAPDDEELDQVGRICRLVEGMPLAILLAASWLDVLSPSEIASRVTLSLDLLAADLADLPARQRSMRAVFDSAWPLLAGAERVTFARLSLFRGPFTAEAAQAVADAGPSMLRALIHKSFLVRGTPGRYEIHLLLRRYGQDRLKELPTEAQEAAERHYRYYAAFVEHHQDAILYADPGQLGPDVEDIRAAWHWAVERGRVEALPLLTTSLYELYVANRRLADGEADMAWAVALLRRGGGEDKQGIALGVVLSAQGGLAHAAGAPQRAGRLFGEGLAQLRRLGAGRELAWACYTAADRGSLQHYGATQDLLLESLAISRQLGLAWEETYVLVDLAALEIRQGNYAEASRYLGRGLALSRQLGFHRQTAVCLLGEGHIAYEQGEYAKARPALQDALALLQSTTPSLVLFAQTKLGDVALAQGAYEEAERHYHLVLSACREQGFTWSEVMAGGCEGVGPALNRLGDVALARGDLGQARARYREALELAAEEPYLGLKLDALARQAVCLAQEGRPERAVELAALVIDHPACANPTRKTTDALLAELQESLSPDTYAAALAQGQAADVDAALRARLTEWHGRLAPG